MAATLLKQTVIENPYIPKLGGLFPSGPQAFFLTAPIEEILYGGAAGGGKSAGILAAGLQYATQPGYDALILRRSFADLEKPGALISLSKEWLSRTDATYNEQTHRWTFPSGATLSFGHLQNDSAVYDYQGSAFAFVGFDELTQFSEFMYRYLFSRLRKASGLAFPVRMRATSNPGGLGHEWVKRRFINAADGIKRFFIPAQLEDNPGLDREQYELSLNELDPVTRKQLRHGDWDVRPEGEMFKRAWFTERMIDRAPPLTDRVRYWDLAATKARAGKDPDYAVGVLAGRDEQNRVYILDVQRFRESPRETEQRVVRTAQRDGREVSIRIEQEPGASAKLYLDSLASGSLMSYDCRGVPSLTDKITRAKPASAAAERGDVYLLAGAWLESFLDELCAFPSVQHDDQVDGFTGAFNELSGGQPWEPSDVAEALSYDD